MSSRGSSGVARACSVAWQAVAAPDPGVLRNAPGLLSVSCAASTNPRLHNIGLFHEILFLRKSTILAHKLPTKLPTKCAVHVCLPTVSATCGAGWTRVYSLAKSPHASTYWRTSVATGNPEPHAFKCAMTRFLCTNSCGDRRMGQMGQFADCQDAILPRLCLFP